MTCLFLKPHLMLPHPDQHPHPFSSNSTLSFILFLLSSVSQWMRSCPLSLPLIHPLPSNVTRAMVFCSACWHMWRIQQLLCTSVAGVLSLKGSSHSPLSPYPKSSALGNQAHPTSLIKASWLPSLCTERDELSNRVLSDPEWPWRIYMGILKKHSKEIGFSHSWKE